MFWVVLEVFVIVVIVCDEEVEIVRLFDVGVYDYFVKLFLVDQFDVCMWVVFCWCGQVVGGGIIEVGGFYIDSCSWEVFFDGKLFDFFCKEFDLFVYLVYWVGEVVLKWELLVEVWCQLYGGADKIVDVYLLWLCRKFGEIVDVFCYIYIVRGVGVKLVVFQVSRISIGGLGGVMLIYHGGAGYFIDGGACFYDFVWF